MLLYCYIIEYGQDVYINNQLLENTKEVEKMRESILNTILQFKSEEIFSFNMVNKTDNGW